MQFVPRNSARPTSGDCQTHTQTIAMTELLQHVRATNWPIYATQFKVPANATCGASPLDNFNGGSWDSNVYYNVSDAEESALRERGFCGFSLLQWQTRGHGARSVVADPGFVDGGRAGLGGGDFQLRAGGPAQARGFVQWEYTAVGPDW